MSVNNTFNSILDERLTGVSKSTFIKAKRKQKEQTEAKGDNY